MFLLEMKKVYYQKDKNCLKCLGMVMFYCSINVQCMCHQSVLTEIKLSHLTLEVQKFISKMKDVKPKCGILHSSQFVLLVISFLLFPVLAT